MGYEIITRCDYCDKEICDIYSEAVAVEALDDRDKSIYSEARLCCLKCRKDVPATKDVCLASWLSPSGKKETVQLRYVMPIKIGLSYFWDQHFLGQ